MEHIKSVFNKASLLTTVLILTWIALGELTLHLTGLPTWPVFACMVCFFLAEQKTSEIAKIVVGAVTGEFMMWVLPVLWMPAVSGALGAFAAQVVFVLIFVGCIVLFGHVLPWFLNSNTFMFFLIAAIATPVVPFTWMAVSAIGGTVIILGCVGISKVVAAACASKETVPVSEAL